MALEKTCLECKASFVATSAQQVCCQRRCTVRRADKRRRQREREGRPPAAPRAKLERKCRWCGRGPDKAHFSEGSPRQCSACYQRGYRNGRDAEGRPIYRSKRGAPGEGEPNSNQSR